MRFMRLSSAAGPLHDVRIDGWVVVHAAQKRDTHAVHSFRTSTSTFRACPCGSSGRNRSRFCILSATCCFWRWWRAQWLASVLQLGLRALPVEHAYIVTKSLGSQMNLQRRRLDAIGLTVDSNQDAVDTHVELHWGRCSSVFR